MSPLAGLTLMYAGSGLSSLLTYQQASLGAASKLAVRLIIDMPQAMFALLAIAVAW